LREDVGRHNALDERVGWARMEGQLRMWKRTDGEGKMIVPLKSHSTSVEACDEA